MDLETELALGFLDYLLVGTSAAPLRKVRDRGDSYRGWILALYLDSMYLPMK